MLTNLILYPILCAVGWYLASQAKITQVIWSRYPAWLDNYLTCSACFGFALGIACGGFGWYRDWSFLGLAGRDPLTVFFIGLCSIWWTPIAARWHIEALGYLAGTPEKVEENGT